MNREAVEKYLKLQEQLAADAKYSELNHEYQEKHHAFLLTLANLSFEQRSVIEDYLGICVELHTRMLQMACLQ